MFISLDQGLEILKVVGLLAGGLWTVWKFSRLQSARTAELEIKLKQTELLRKQPLIAIDLNVIERILPLESPKSFLYVTVTIKNEGEQNFATTFDGTELTVGRISFGTNGPQTITNICCFGHWYFLEDEDKSGQVCGIQVPERVFRVGQKRQLPFIVEIAEPGWYLIHFHTEYEWCPFDNEPPPKKNEPLSEVNPIDAFEQVIYFAKGRHGETEAPPDK
jgi:hypothetical protein